MPGQVDVQPLLKLLPQRFQPAVLELDHAVAVGADDVMVMPARHQYVGRRHAAFDVSRADQVQLCEQIERAKYARPPDTGIAFAHALQQRGRGDMSIACFQRVEHGQAGVGQFIPGIAQALRAG